MNDDTPSISRPEEHDKEQEREVSIVAGMGFWRIVWAVALGILLANLISFVLTFVLPNLGALLPGASR